jgi:hypothetical protein
MSDDDQVPELEADASGGGKSRKKRGSFEKSQRESVYNSAVLLCGLLAKKSGGAVARWQKRYFEAAGHYLNYYADESKFELKGSLDMSSTISVKLKVRLVRARDCCGSSCVA